MGAVIYALILDKKNLKKEKAELENKLASARTNIEQLSDFISNSNKIHKEEKELAEKIKDAETDEEVHDIINDIISLNNARMQNNKN
jgi:C4-dicarboxylate-specific signal transduction histidine kinase